MVAEYAGDLVARDVHNVVIQMSNWLQTYRVTKGIKKGLYVLPILNPGHIPYWRVSFEELVNSLCFVEYICR